MGGKDVLTAQKLAIEALRQLDPRRLPYVTEEPWATGGARWAYHPVRRHLILRSINPDETVRALACVMLAKDSYLGPRSVTEVPEHLAERHRVFCQQIEDMMWALQR